jgi:protein phosphatase
VDGKSSGLAAAPGHGNHKGGLVNWEDVIVEAAATDTGMRRANNQDSFAIVRAPNPETWKSRGHLFMVADGMGAHAVGELASKLACDYVPHTYHKTKVGTPSEALTKAFRDVGGQIYSKAQANPDFHRMGTTCTSLVLLPAGVLIAHVGDSRAYRVRDGRIDQLSFDHSLVWELVKKGHMKPEQASKAYPKNVITRSLGPEPTVEVDIEGPLAVERGDVYVICSDGLSGPVADPEIGAIASQFHPEDAVRYLTHLANLRGGMDNVTVIVVRVGPWVEPGTGEDNGQPAQDRKKGSLLSNLFGGWRNKAEPEVEQEPYVSAECPLDAKLVGTIADVVKNAQAAAVEQAWNVEWPELTERRKKAEAAFSSGDLRACLHDLGEAVALLGQAGRKHRKEMQKNGR